MDGKEAAGRRAAEYVEDGMTLGLGTGSTSVHFITAVGERMKREGLKLRGVPTSDRSRKQAMELGIPIVDLSEAGILDIAVDGADEVDRDFSLIKGGGGALLREKLVAAASRQFIVICDDNKLRNHLGTFPLPVAIIPFGWKTTMARIEKYCPSLSQRMTAGDPSTPYLSDDGLYILDLNMGAIEDPPALERNLKQITGVAEVGLFVGLTSRVIVGYADGHIEELVPSE